MAAPFEDNSPLPEASRSKVARDLLVFQVKLFTDGLKDIALSPIALVAGLLGIFLSRGNPGAPLYEVLRAGQRAEHWIDLFAAAYTSDAPISGDLSKPDDTGEDPDSSDASQDLDALLDRLQSNLMNPEQRARLSERSRAQLDMIAKKIRGD